MADITNLFSATIKTIKTRHKAQGKATKKDEKHPIFPATKHRGQFETTAKEVVCNTFSRLLFCQKFI